MSAASGSSASRPSAHALHAAAASAQHTAKPVATSDRVIDIAIMVFLYFAFAYMVTCVARASQLLQLLRAMQPRVFLPLLRLDRVVANHASARRRLQSMQPAGSRTGIRPQHRVFIFAIR